MQTIKSFFDQLLLIWKDSTASARIGLALLAMICLGAIAGVGFWSAQPHYIVLAQDLSPANAGKIMNALDAADIAYEVKGTGSIIMVDQRKWARAQIAAGKLGIGGLESGKQEISPWMDPKNQQDILRRNQEAALENSLQRFKAVEKADVQLSIPEKQVFVNRRSDAPSAGVVLEIANKASLKDHQAAAIVAHVANAVPGLVPERVSLSDTDGNTYTTDQSMGRVNKQEEFRIQRDRELANKVEKMLSRFLGIGNAEATVTTDFTFPDETTESTKVDPDNKVVIDEMITNTTATGMGAPGGGDVGITGNSDTENPSAINSSEIITKKEDLKSTYEISKTHRTETKTSPELKSISVSVLVNSKSLEDETGVISEEQKTNLESVVRQAVGYREDVDQLSVEYFPFVDVLPMDDPTAMVLPWDKINSILKNISLGIAAIVAFFVAVKALRKIQPDPTAVQAAADRATQVNQLSELVKQNPEVFTKIIESWSNLDSKDKSTDQPTRKAA